ncbi:hypothetical protein ElyMa_002738000 [Elysia marginata]|uniref:Uncharacterized protein n=1 Tax=Elysia marginata TaxID=1093978 RepID=A0AAV4HHQ8_9GAST|nr:hypothetical protein ElyMa_002738000 [Elysia marginata]
MLLSVECRLLASASANAIRAAQATISETVPDIREKKPLEGDAVRSVSVPCYDESCLTKNPPTTNLPTYQHFDWVFNNASVSKVKK